MANINNNSTYFICLYCGLRLHTDEEALQHCILIHPIEDLPAYFAIQELPPQVLLQHLPAELINEE